MSTAILFAACLVIGVADGDTLRVKCPQRVKAFPLRLSGLDAPEKANRGFGWEAQPGNVESTAALSALCQGQTVNVRRIGFDRDQRAIGYATCRGQDASATQLAAGHAWAEFAEKKNVAAFADLEAGARAAGRGLWALPSPVRPAVWRKGVTSCR